MRVLVCGSRDWINRAAILRELSKFPPGTVVIQGGCRGADRLAAEIARELGFTVKEFRADWQRYGPRAAGPIRNRRMLDEGKPDLVLAFHAAIKKSRGMADIVRQARRAGVPVRVITN
ncbi:MAG: DUF2493 domain-containing protein [Bacillota bacterium]